MTGVPYSSKGLWIILLLIFPGGTFKMFLCILGCKVKWTVPSGQSIVLHRASWSKTGHWMEESADL